MKALYFLKIEGIEGESRDSNHKKWINIISCNSGMSQAVTESSSTGGKIASGASFQDFTISKGLDASTPDLNMFCCTGKHIPKVEIELSKQENDQRPFMKYELNNVIISSVSLDVDASGDESKALETITLSYGKIKWEYTPTKDEDGQVAPSIDRTWNLEENKQD